jgi:Uma2 family endonuclease
MTASSVGLARRRRAHSLADMNGRWHDEWVSVQDYLDSEVHSRARREYVGGIPYAMAGARNAHNRIATNVLIALGIRLRGSACQPFNSDTKLRVRLPFEERFYYPDALVTCRPNPMEDVFQDEPAVLVEVLSPPTRRIDEGEKLLAYQAIPSLGVYLLLEQDSARAIGFRRTDAGFVREVHLGKEAVVALPEIGCALPLAEAYEGITFAG